MKLPVTTTLAAAAISFPMFAMANTQDPAQTFQPQPQPVVSECSQMEQNLQIPAEECGTKTPAELAEMMADRY
ncbi:MAG: hypothetical protein AAFV27_10455 [Pseudomonadota bacterium]